MPSAEALGVQKPSLQVEFAGTMVQGSVNFIVFWNACFRSSTYLQRCMFARDRQQQHLVATPNQGPIRLVYSSNSHGYKQTGFCCHVQVDLASHGTQLHDAKEAQQ